MFVGNDATGGLPITEGFVFDVRKSRQRNDDVFTGVCCAGERRIVERVSEIGRNNPTIQERSAKFRSE